MASIYKGPDFTSTNKAKLNDVSTTVQSNSSMWGSGGSSPSISGDFTSYTVSAQNVVFTSAITVTGGTYTGTGVYLTLNINGSALYLPLYQ